MSSLIGWVHAQNDPWIYPTDYVDNGRCDVIAIVCIKLYVPRHKGVCVENMSYHKLGEIMSVIIIMLSWNVYQVITGLSACMFIIGTQEYIPY